MCPKKRRCSRMEMAIYRALRLLKIHYTYYEVRGLKVCFPWRLQYFRPFEVIFWICKRSPRKTGLQTPNLIIECKYSLIVSSCREWEASPAQKKAGKWEGNWKWPRRQVCFLHRPVSHSVNGHFHCNSREWICNQKNEQDGT